MCVDNTRAGAGSLKIFNKLINYCVASCQTWMLGRRAQLNITWLNKQNSLMKIFWPKVDFDWFYVVWRTTWLISLNPGLPSVGRWLSLLQGFESVVESQKPFVRHNNCKIAVQWRFSQFVFHSFFLNNEHSGKCDKHRNFWRRFFERNKWQQDFCYVPKSLINSDDADDESY